MLASVDVLTVRYIIVSSAKSRTLLLTELGRSFIYARCGVHTANNKKVYYPLFSGSALNYLNAPPPGGEHIANFSITGSRNQKQISAKFVTFSVFAH